LRQPNSHLFSIKKRKISGGQSVKFGRVSLGVKMSHRFGWVYEDDGHFVGCQNGRGVFSAGFACQSLTAVVICVIFFARYVVCSIAVRGPSDEEESYLSGMERRMRADEREKLLKEIEKKEEAEATRSMYFRVGKTAHKAITELAAISGANKSEIVRKLVTRALTGKDIEIAKESHSVKLDWLVRESKRKRIDGDALKKSIDDIRERIDWIESSELESSNTFRKLLLEMYCILLAVF
jgi:hypothetical protein